MDDFDNLFPVSTTDRKWQKKKETTNNLKQGKFTEEEETVVKESLKNYALSHNLSEDEFSGLIANSQKTTMPKAWLEIAKALPNRTVQSVYKFVKSKWNPDNYKGHWTQEEEQQLLQLVNQYGRKFNVICKTLNRTPLNIKDKLRQLGDHNYESRNLIWKVGEVVYFLRLLEKMKKTTFLKENWDDILNEEFGDDWQNIIINNSSQKKRFKKITYYQITQDETQITQLIKILDLPKFNALDSQNIQWSTIADKIKTKSHDDLRNFWNQSLNYWRMLMKTTVDDEQLVNDIIIQDPLSETDINFDMVLKNYKVSLNDKLTAWTTLKKRVQVRDQYEFDELLENIRKLVSKSKKKDQKTSKYEEKVQKSLKSANFNNLMDEYKELIGLK